MKQVSSTILKSRNFERVLMTTATSSKKSIVQISNQLKQLAQNQGLLSLSANQIGSQYSMFVMLQKNLMKPNKFFSYKYKSNQYSSFINPKILDFSVDEFEGWEECASYPNIRFKIKRSTHIIVEYEKSFRDKAPVREEWKGFEAVVFQHEFTHTQCKNLFDLADDVELVENPRFSQNVRQKLKYEFLKFKNPKNQQQNPANSIEMPFQKQQSKGMAVLNQNSKNSTLIYSNCKSLRDFVEYEIVDPI